MIGVSDFDEIDSISPDFILIAGDAGEIRIEIHGEADRPRRQEHLGEELHDPKGE